MTADDQALLDRRAAALASRSTTGESRRVEPVMRLALGDQSFVIAMRFVFRVMPDVTPTPIPGVGGEILGVVPSSGQILMVVDLRRLLRLPAAAATSSALLVVIGGDQPDLVLKCDSTVMATAVDLDLLRESPANDEGLSMLARGITAEGDVYIDAEQLLVDRRLFIGRAPDPTSSRSRQESPP